ncbi:MAG: ATP-binding protein [Methanosarcinaceae archaeon]|nr:ATP-binding protein [Methanosarcinaceae archaeon]
MIIELSIQNIFSIKDRQTLSFVATDDKTLDEYYVVRAGRYNLLKTAVLYGPNASGKSNVLKAFDILRAIAISPSPDNAVMPWYPFQFNPETKQENSTIELRFMVPENNEENDFTEYEYLLAFNSEKIVHEKLSCYLSSRASVIYERTDRNNIPEIRFGKASKLKAFEQKAISANTVKTSTVLSSLRKVSVKWEPAGKVLDWFEKKTYPMIGAHTYLIDRSSKYLFDTKSGDHLVSILSKADLNISGVRFEKREGPEIKVTLAQEGKDTENELPFPVQIQSQKKEFLDIFLEHSYITGGKTERADLPYMLESEGTHRSFDLSGLFLMAVRENRTLLIDEIESSLHYDILKYFLLIFLKNSRNAQLIFTTHNLMLLNADFIRKDTIWFTEKKDDASTSLYSLVEFKGIDRMNILKSYMAGKFGAYPDIYDFDLQEKYEKKT